MAKPMDPTENMDGYELGRYLGYPECCIKWFIEVRIQTLAPLTPQQDAVHNNHGFIPCPECAKKVTADTVHTLIKNRVCPTPYPKFDH